MSRFEHEWERKLDERLKALPSRRAPESLLSKVLAEARARERARSGLFGRLPGWLGSLGLALAAAGAVWLLRLEASLVIGAAVDAAGPWLPVAKGLLRALSQIGQAASAACWQWRLPLAAAAAASLTACAGGTVALGVLVGAGNIPWRTR